MVGKTLTDSLAVTLSANRRSKSDGELFTSAIQRDNGDIPGFSTLPLWNIPPGSKVQACSSRLLSLCQDSGKTCLCLHQLFLRLVLLRFGPEPKFEPVMIISFSLALNL